jgi:hypothetical protein
MTTRYWIAQHINDVFRNEPRNIGVFVQSGDRVDAKFFGETDYMQLDGRKLRNFSYPDVYKQWIEFWRKELANSTPEAIAELSGSHYRVVEGGQLDEVQESRLSDATNYLYTLLVSEGGIQDVLAANEETCASCEPVILSYDVAVAFEQERILAEGEELFVPHPIRRQIPIKGVTGINHKPSFVQQNGNLFVMETIDFTTFHKKGSRDHAGWTAYMFKDIREENKNTVPYAIVKVNDEDKIREEVSNGLTVLAKEGEIVNWLNDNERNTFIRTRKEVAMAR